MHQQRETKQAEEHFPITMTLTCFNNLLLRKTRTAPENKQRKSLYYTTYVVLSYAFPISLETVSLNFVQKLATKPSCQS